MTTQPSYIILYENGELESRIESLMTMLQPCRLCPRNCKVNRLDGELGTCNAGTELVISSSFPHFGEEEPLVGFSGSGTIFLTHCNLRCKFCQNDDISHGGQGWKMSTDEFARALIALQNRGCHNINFVTPTHFTAQIVAALPKAIDLGLRLPLVYNCGGYESVETLQLLDGIIDIYMPDAKFSGAEQAERYCHAQDYFKVMQSALKEMHHQVGVLQTDARGIAVRGLLIRHLVLPNCVAGSKKIFQFIAEELSPDSYVNVMSQYRPCCMAYKFPEIRRRLTHQEFEQARQLAHEAGLHRGF